MTEPAVVSYFFGPGYQQLREIAGEAWAQSSKVAGDLASQSGTSMPSDPNAKDPATYWHTAVAASYGAASLLAYVSAGLCLFLLTAIHGLVLATGSTLALATAVVLRVTDFIWRKIWQIGHPCPHCYHRGKPPVYLCPNCNAAHYQLTPGKYGVLRRFCECGTNLPVLDVLGRGSLECRCADCNHHLTNLQTTDLHVAFVGGPSSGKTSLFLMQFQELVNRHQEAGFEKVLFAEASQKQYIDGQLANLRAGRRAAKTTDIAPRAVHLVLRPAGRPVDKSLYFYDVAGEAFNTEDAAGRHLFYDHIDGIVFVIDPFSLAEVREKYRTELDAAGAEVQACPLTPEEAYGRMLSALQTYCRQGAAGVKSAQLAVVISKVDLFDLESLLGDAGAGARPPAEPVNERCRAWLEANGESNLVRLMESDFRSVRYFSASALGHRPGGATGAASQGIRVIEPLLWSLKNRLGWKALSGARDGQ